MRARLVVARASLSLAAVVLILFAGCGGGSSSPPPPRVSVSIAPAKANVTLGASQQFTATVTGTSSTLVSWSVNGVLGGNASIGTIDAAGLYTAPAILPNSSTVTISATSQADSTASDQAITTVTSDLAITVTTNPSQLQSVPTGLTIALMASIASHGKPDLGVKWSVNGIAGGNSTVGTVSSDGTTTASYQAPPSVPTPFTVTVMATSVADPSKNATLPMVVAGTIASVTQNISAANGGTISLPDGSGVTIAAGVLAGDQILTLTEVSYLPNQPPNIAIASVGPGLILSFGTPIQFAAATSVMTNPSSNSFRAAGQTERSALSSFLFTVNAGNNDTALLPGSMPTVNFVDTLGNNNFAGVDGNYNSTTSTATGNVRVDLLSAFSNMVIRTIQFAAMNLRNPLGILPLVPGPITLGQSGGHLAWLGYSGCPNGNALVLVHGMLSSVEASFPPTLAQKLQFAGGNDNYYQTVIGFDYDWLNSINSSGASLASFLSSCPNATFDIEAHSEGVAVTLAAMASLVQSRNQAIGQIKHLISLGGPIRGTPAANDIRILQSLILDMPNVSLATQAIDLASILASPFVNDLKVDSPTLQQIQSTIASRSFQNAPQIIAIGGTAQRLTLFKTDVNGTTATLSLNMSPFSQLMGTTYFDGIIPLKSALAYDTGLNVYPRVFPIGHTEFASDLLTMQFVDSEIKAIRNPSLVCSTSNCTGARSDHFAFVGTEFNYSPAAIHVYSQDSSGAVVPLPITSMQDLSGNIDWSIAGCSTTVGRNSIFIFDDTLASNNVMQTVNSGACAVSPAGIVQTVVGTGIAGYTGDKGLADMAELNVPSGIAFDSAGNMFIADAYNNVIRRVDVTTKVITTIAGTGTGSFSGDGSPAIKAQLSEPTHIAFDHFNNLYFADANNARIRKIDTTGIITTFAGNGLASFSGDNGPAINAGLNFPDGIAIDSFNNVYIGDANNNRIRKVDAVTGIITTVAGNGNNGFSGDGDLATNAELSFPSRPALDSSGNLYIADYRNNRVRRVDAITGMIATVAGSGTAGFSGDGGPARSAELNGPITVTLDTSGNLYIGDITNSRIRVVNTGTINITVAGQTIQPGEITTIAGNGVTGYQGDGGPATNAELNFPTGILLDPAGNLYFADALNNVVRMVSLQ